VSRARTLVAQEAGGRVGVKRVAVGAAPSGRTIAPSPASVSFHFGNRKGQRV
jgi:hypothetical protein